MGRNAIDPYDQSYRRKNMKKNTQALCQLLMVTCISVSTISIAQEVDSVTHRPNSEKLASQL
jgi:hypothetical protein